MGSTDSPPAPARWWRRLEGEGPRFRCELCPRGCVLEPGQRGFCFVRMAGAQGMVLDTYGRSSGFAVDPIEKKPLYHFLPGSEVLSFGTAGCNLGCRFCQNWDLSRARRADRAQAQASPARIAALAAKQRCASVAFTYNEPIVFAEYAVDTARACREAGLRTVAVSAGFIEPAPREEFFGVMDAANIDLKSFSDAFYRRLCGARLDPVLDTLRFLAQETDILLEVTTLLIPGENDSDAELHGLCAFVAGELGVEVPLHFSAFHPSYQLTDRPRTPHATQQRARRVAREHGLQHVYLGNVYDPEASSTYCAACGERLIERARYQLGARRLVDGACARCGEPLHGVFG
jgi:pyruvate formate lyase activating enzyme